MKTKIRAVLRNLFAGATASVDQSMQYIEPRFLMLALVAMVGFPLYYLVWHDVYPQPYENLTLRLIGSAMFLPFMFVKFWPRWLHRYLSIYWYLAILYALPFFFTFMLLMNGVSTVWLMSTLVAVFLMILLLNLYTLIIQFTVGSSLAWVAYFLVTGHVRVPTEYWQYMPVYVFAIVSGGLLNFSYKMVQQERLRAMLAVTSNIAHELRTPLLGIKSGAAGLRQYLPSLLDAYRLAKAHNLNVEPIRGAHMQSMQGVLERIESEANHSNTIIDMLLMNTRADGLGPESLGVCSISKCVEAALDRYPFSSEKERHLVYWNNEAEFQFRGIELLMVHVVFNLMKNALYAIAKGGKGSVFIRSASTARCNILTFRDTGVGIPPEILPHIFTPFYSWSSDGDRGLGAGVGLAFCRSVVQAFGGSITCESELGEYTEFTLAFPCEQA